MSNNKCISLDFAFLKNINNELGRLKPTELNNDIFIKALNNVLNNYSLTNEDIDNISEYIKDNQKTVFKFFDKINQTNLNNLDLKQIITSNLVVPISIENNKPLKISQDFIENLEKNNFNFLDDSGEFTLTNTLSNIDSIEFNKNVKDSLIRLSFINNLGEYHILNTNVRKFNEAITAKKNILANNLYKFLVSKGIIDIDKYSLEEIFTKNQTDLNKLNLLLNDSKIFFSKYLNKDGIFSSENTEEKNLFFDFILLSNFDEILKNNNDLKSLIRINYNAKEGENHNKYIFIFGLQKDADFNDNLEDINSYTNKLVKYFIESLKNGNNNIKFNDFNNMIIHLKKLGYFTSSKLNILSTRFGIKKEFENIFNDINTNNSLFKNENSLYKPIFYTIYNELFSNTNINNLHQLSINLNENEILNRDNDLYTMVLNHINKTTNIEYVETTIKDGEQIISPIESKIIKNIKSDIINVLVANINKNDGTNYNLYNIKPIKENNKILSFDFSIPSDTKILKFNVTYSANPKLSLYSGNSLINVEKTFRDLLLSNKKEFSNLFKNLLYYNSINENFIDTLYNSYSDNILDLIPTIGTLIASHGLQHEFKNLKTSSEKQKIYNNTLNNSFYQEEKTKTSVNKIINSEGYLIPHKLILKSHIGLDLIGNTIAIVNNLTNKSNVTDAIGNKLPIGRLQNLINSDKTLFQQIVINEENVSLSENPFILDMKHNSSSRTEEKWHKTLLQTAFTTIDKQSRNIKELTLAENLYNQVYSNYFLAKINNKFLCQPTTFSDKETIWLKEINLSISFNGNLDGVLLNKTTKEIYDLHEEKLKFFYNSIREELIKDYNKIFITAKEIGNINFDDIILDDYKSLTDGLKRISEEELHAILFNIISKDENFKFIDGVHFVRDKEKFLPNLMLEKNIEIINNKELIEEKRNIEKKLYGGLLSNNGVFFSLVLPNGDPNNTLLESIKKSFLIPGSASQINNDDYKNYLKEWTNQQSQKLINYKLYKKENNTIIEIEPSSDIYKDLYNSEISNDPDYIIVLNPELDRFFALDNFISGQYAMATVGLSYNKPFKVSSVENNLNDWTSFKNIEAAQAAADSKRAIIYNSTITPLISNLLQGVRNKMKVAMVYDPRATSINLNGTQTEVDIYDGATWLNPFTAVLIKNSLTEMNLDPYHLKPIGHYNHAKYGSSTIHKTAEHTITNFTIRNSINSRFNGEHLLKQLSNIIWDTDINILKKTIIKNTYFFDKENNKYVKIKNMVYKGDNNYIISYEDVDELGNVISSVYSSPEAVKIDSNYKLWKVLGGAYSMKQNFENTLIFSESSIDKVVEIMNNTTFKKDNSNSSEIMSQESMDQPLKRANIDKIIFTSSTKHNPFNINSLEKLLNNPGENSVSNLLTGIVDNTFMGIQLNAGHDLSDSSISEMTQVIAAISQLGLNQSEVNIIYDSIGQIIRSKITELSTEEDSKKATYDDITKSLAKSYINQNTDISLATTYLKYILQNIKNGEAINIQDYDIITPFDSGSLFKIFTNNITGKINREIIKRTFNGTGAVVAPAHDFIRVFEAQNGQIYTHEELLLNKNKGNEIKLDSEVSIGNIIIGDTITYKLFDKEYTQKVVGKLKNGLPYDENEISLYYLKSLRKYKIDKITKINSLGRNLRTRNTTVTLITGETFDLFDLDVSKLLNNLDDFMKQGNRHLDFESLNNIYNNVKERLKKKHNLTEENLNLIIFNNFTNNDGNHFIVSKDNKEFKYFKKYLKGLLQDDLNDITDNNLFRIPLEFNNTTTDLIQISSKTHQNDEIVLGNIYKEQFMLKEGDNINDIINDKDFFKNRMESFYNTDVPKDLYDLYLISQKGNHLHVVFDHLPEKYNNLIPLEIKKIIKGNQTYRIDEKGNILYPITDDMKFYSYSDPINQINRDIVVTSPLNASKFNERRVFSYTRINYNISNNKNINIYNLLTSRFIDGKLVLSLVDEGINIEDFNNLTSFGNLTNKQIKLLETLKNKQKITESYIDKNNKEEEEAFKNFKENHSSKMYESFKTSLNFISARIPTQSMQSFMNVTVVGFISTDKESNVIYAPIEQMVYQGADYDIDKEYLLGAHIDKNGIYTGWSPFFNYKSSRFFELSNELPLPIKNIKFIQGINKETGLDLTSSNRELLMLLQFNGININDIDEVRNSIKNNEIHFESFVKLLKNINFDKNNNFTVELSGLHDNLFILVQEHFNYNLSSIVLEQSIKNKIYYNLIKIGKHEKSILIQTTPMDLDIITSIGKESDKHKKTSLASNDSPGNKMLSQDNNLIGKSNVGITANWNKLFSNVLNYYHNVINSDNVKIENHELILSNLIKKKQDHFIFYLKGEAHNVYVNPLISNINVNSLNLTNIEKEKVNNFLNFKSGVKLGESLEAYQLLLDRLRPNEDTFDMLSQLLSAAVDNAKELALDKINASKELLPLFTTLLMKDMNFRDICRLMSSNEVSLLVNKLRDNIIFNKKFKLAGAISYYVNGVPVDYIIGDEYVDSLNKNAQKFIESKLKKDFLELIYSEETLKDKAQTYFDFLYGDSKNLFRNLILLLVDKNPELLKVYKKELETAVILKKNKVKNNLEYNDEGEYIPNIDDFFDTTENDFSIENLMYDDESISNEVKDEKYKIFRYIEEAEMRQYDLNKVITTNHSFDMIKVNYDILNQVNKESKEYKALLKFLAYNQGIDVNIDEKINKLMRLNSDTSSLFSERKELKKINTEFRDKYNLGKNLFDLFLFLNNEEYKKDIIGLYEYSKDNINILHLISNSKNYMEILNSIQLDFKLNSEFSRKYTELNNILIKNPNIPIDKKSINNIIDFLNDSIIIKFLKTSNLHFNLPVGSVLYNEGDSVILSNNFKISFDESDNIRSYKNWVENNFKNELIKAFPDNLFVKNLNKFYYENNQKVFTSALKLTIDLVLNQDENSTIINSIIKSFNDIKDLKFSVDNDFTVEDVLYLYNIIQNKDKVSAYSLTNLFKDLNIGRVDSVGHKFIKFMGDISLNNSSIYKFTSEDYNINDMFVNFQNLDINNNISMKIDKDKKTILINYSYKGAIKPYENIYYEDNVLIYPNLWGSSNIKYNEKIRELYKKIINLINSDKIELKLC